MRDLVRSYVTLVITTRSKVKSRIRKGVGSGERSPVGSIVVNRNNLADERKNGTYRYSVLFKRRVYDSQMC
jgi:hypothetical protein